jgi:hypothetical protein
VHEPPELGEMRGVLEIRGLGQLDADEDGPQPTGTVIRHGGCSYQISHVHAGACLGPGRLLTFEGSA